MKWWFTSQHCCPSGKEMKETYLYELFPPLLIKLSLLIVAPPLGTQLGEGRRMQMCSWCSSHTLLPIRTNIRAVITCFMIENLDFSRLSTVLFFCLNRNELLPICWIVLYCPHHIWPPQAVVRWPVSPLVLHCCLAGMPQVPHTGSWDSRAHCLWLKA